MEETSLQEIFVSCLLIFKDAKSVSFCKDGKKEKCRKLRMELIISVVPETVLKAVIYQQNTLNIRHSVQITNMSVGLTLAKNYK